MTTFETGQNGQLTQLKLANPEDPAWEGIMRGSTPLFETIATIGISAINAGVGQEKSHELADDFTHYAADISQERIDMLYKVYGERCTVGDSTKKETKIMFVGMEIARFAFQAGKFFSDNHQEINDDIDYAERRNINRSVRAPVLAPEQRQATRGLFDYAAASVESWVTVIGSTAKPTTVNVSAVLNTNIQFIHGMRLKASINPDKGTGAAKIFTGHISNNFLNPEDFSSFDHLNKYSKALSTMSS